jgi:hypothetical protein
MDSWIEIRPLEVAAGLSRRVAERAAWRAVVRERLGDDVVVGYNKNGAPVLEGAPGDEGLPGGDGSSAGDGSSRGDGSPGYISVSHTRGWVAVIWSTEPCAIDIELRDRTISEAAAARYSLGSMEDWCALEARYKYAGLTGREPAPDSVRFLPHPQLIVAVIGDLIR